MADSVDSDDDDCESETEAHVRRGLQKKAPAVMNVEDMVGDEESGTSDDSPVLLGQRFSEEKEDNPPSLPGVSDYSQRQYAGAIHRRQSCSRLSLRRD